MISFFRTLGHNQHYIFSNNFYLISNVNISNPNEYDVLNSNSNILLNTHGFINNVSVQLISNNSILDSFNMTQNNYSYSIPNIQEFCYNNISLVFREDYYNIERRVNNLKTPV